MGYFRPFNLRSPVLKPHVINVSLETSPSRATEPVPVPDKPLPTKSIQAEYQPINRPNRPEIKNLPEINGNAQQSEIADNPSAIPAAPIKDSADQIIKTASKADTSSVENKHEEPVFTPVPVPQVKELAKGPVRTGNEFVPVSSEKLTYRIMLYGIPAGSAVLEATNTNGEVRITTRVTSNDVFSSFYPVDIFVDTRLMVGNYLLTRIRQHEGSNISDTGFTLMLREKNAFWVDRSGRDT